MKGHYFRTEAFPGKVTVTYKGRIVAVSEETSLYERVMIDEGDVVDLSTTLVSTVFNARGSVA